MNLRPSSTILRSGDYIDGVKPFIASYGAIWENVRCQVLKLETRQSYVEIDNPSYDLWCLGREPEARELIASQRATERSRYHSLRNRGVDFVRCRPIAFPISSYLEWEIENYRHNEMMGERIFWCNELALHEVFKNYATHDFLIFDARLAAVTNHDEDGKMIGGWVVNQTEDIMELMKQFIFIKSQSTPLAMLPGR